MMFSIKLTRNGRSRRGGPSTRRVRTLIGVCALTCVAAGCARFFFPITRSSTTTTAAFRNDGETLSFFTAVQVDPRSEDSAGPQFVTAGDLNGDGLIDLASGWNETQPVQIHLQERSANNAITFETVTLGGNVPIALIAGLGIADFDSDGRNDVVVLVKDKGGGGLCRTTGEPILDASTGVIVIYFGPASPLDAANPLAWQDVELPNSLAQGSAPGELPEEGGYTSLAVGDIDGVNGPDLLVAFNPTGCDGEGGQIDIYDNPGAAAARTGGEWTPTSVYVGDAINSPDDPPRDMEIKDVALSDVDRDGDLDIIATLPSSASLNVRWFRNPRLDVPDEYHVSDGAWHMGVIGQIATGADAISVGDLDQDGIADVVIRSTGGMVIQWLQGPRFPTTAPVRNIPWRVYTLAEFRDRVPLALSTGDVTGDGRLDVVTSAGGALVFFSTGSIPDVYDQWWENLVVDEGATDTGGGTGATGIGTTTTPTTGATGTGATGSGATGTEPVSAGPPTTDPGVLGSTLETEPTMINTLLVVDLDGDGDQDIIGTLDRQGHSGLSNDALIWYRNNRRTLASP